MSPSYFSGAIYSLIIHILIILSIFNYISVDTTSVGYQNVLQAYVITKPVIISKQDAHINLHSVKLLRSRTRSNIAYKSKAIGVKNTTKKLGKPNKLLIILHNQIQQQINNSDFNLPKSVRSRFTDVQFLLTPEGQVTNINIAKSSGMIFLDNLAVKAVNAIQPCFEARKYLSTSSYFSIKVYYNS